MFTVQVTGLSRRRKGPIQYKEKQPEGAGGAEEEQPEGAGGAEVIEEIQGHMESSRWLL